MTIQQIETKYTTTKPAMCKAENIKIGEFFTCDTCLYIKLGTLDSEGHFHVNNKHSRQVVGHGFNTQNVVVFNGDDMLCLCSKVTIEYSHGT